MDKKTIIKIANLAKLEIKDDKLNDIASSLEKILNLVDEMNGVNTDDVAPMSHPLNLKQELRKDEVKEANQRDCLLYTSPSPRDGLLSRMPSSA